MVQQQLRFPRRPNTRNNPPPPPTVATESSILSDLDSEALEPIEIDDSNQNTSQSTTQANAQSANESPVPGTPATPSESSTTTLPPSKQKQRARTSFIYDHMRDWVPRDHVFKNIQGQAEWRCRYCLQNYIISGGTRGPENHLAWHEIYRDSPKDKRAKNIQIDIKRAMDSAAENPQKRRRLNSEEPTAIPVDGDVLEVLFVKFLAVCNQPLRLVECPEFRALLTYLNKDVDKWLNTSHNTIRKWVLRQAEIQEKYQMQRLQNSRSKIHISTDLWTSPNDRAIMVVVAHYLSEDNVLERVVLDLMEVDGSHEGVNLASYIMKTIDHWGIASKLGWFVMDNAANNDTLMKRISFGKFGFFFLDEW
jgi:hypothetical protein